LSQKVYIYCDKLSSLFLCPHELMHHPNIGASYKLQCSLFSEHYQKVTIKCPLAGNVHSPVDISI